MTNKTSDKNVGNKIKQQTENTIKYYKNIDNIEEVPIDILRAMYKDILSDYTRQKQINEEHKRINGELRERVKELEEENTLQRRQLNSAFDNGYIHTDKIRKLIASETINISGFECIALEDLQELLGGESK